MKVREPSKADVALHWIASGWILIHFDATRFDVQVPSHLRDREDCVFEIGFDMPIPIPDLKIDQTGVGGTFSFGATRQRVHVPWTAVFCITQRYGDEVALWWHDAPQSVRDRMLETVVEQNPASGLKPQKKTRSRVPHLRRVK